MKKVLVTGAAGMVGTSLVPHLRKAGYDVLATDINTATGAKPLDVRDTATVNAAADAYQPDLVIHLAAETDVDLCEVEPRHAYCTNALATQNVAYWCRVRERPMVYVSTAGVFDGRKDAPYHEFDDPNPVMVYGRSKLAGERIVKEQVPRHFIVRAGWMVGGADVDKKFVAKIIRQIKAGAKTIYAVDDKLGTPTYTKDFSRTMQGLVETDHYGLYHMVCKGGGSRYDVAVEIVRFLGADASVEPVSSDFFKEDYPAPRPRSEMMENMMLELRGLDRMRPWKEALHEYLHDNYEALGAGVKKTPTVFT